MSNVVIQGKHLGAVKEILANHEGSLITASQVLEIARAEGIDGTASISKFGTNTTTENGDTIWSNGGVYVPPTVTNGAQIHEVSSLSIEDAGTLVHTGTTTSIGDAYTLIDTAATFVTDSVAVGDAVLNDTAFDHSVVLTVDSETQLTLVGYHDAIGIAEGDTYRVVTPNGTGCAVMHIKNGLDATFDFMGEFIIMNGTTVVNTVGEYYRLNRMHNDLCGSAGTNVGVIQAEAADDNTVTCAVPAGVGQSELAHFTIPRGKEGYVLGYYVSVTKSGGGAQAADVFLMFNKFAPVNSVGAIKQHGIGISTATEGYIYHEFRVPLRVREQVDVFMKANQVSASMFIEAGFDLVMLDRPIHTD